MTEVLLLQQWVIVDVWLHVEFRGRERGNERERGFIEHKHLKYYCHAFLYFLMRLEIGLSKELFTSVKRELRILKNMKQCPQLICSQQWFICEIRTCSINPLSLAFPLSLPQHGEYNGPMDPSLSLDTEFWPTNLELQLTATVVKSDTSGKLKLMFETHESSKGSGKNGSFS